MLNIVQEKSINLQFLKKRIFIYFSLEHYLIKDPLLWIIDDY
jgi:hypothetical protein